MTRRPHIFTNNAGGEPTDTSERIDEVLYGAEDAHELRPSDGCVRADRYRGGVWTSVHQPLRAGIASLLLYRSSHRDAVTALTEIRASETINLLTVAPTTFETTCEQFERYADQAISFIDHLSSVLAAEHDIQHIFAFDSDFATLGFTRVPVDTGIP